jgi:hypothetical protein
MVINKQEVFRMKRTNRVWMLGGLVTLTLLLSACSIELERNADGSLAATTVIDGDSLEEEMELALDYNDSLVQNVEVVLQDGTIDMTIERAHFDDSSVTDTITFDMILGVDDGQLTVTFSDVQLNGEAAPEEAVERWSTRIANRLSVYHSNNERRSLEAVTVTPDAVMMVWRIETRYSLAD